MTQWASVDDGMRPVSCCQWKSRALQGHLTCSCRKLTWACASGHLHSWSAAGQPHLHIHLHVLSPANTTIATFSFCLTYLFPDYSRWGRVPHEVSQRTSDCWCKIFYMLDAPPVIQHTASNHWRNVTDKQRNPTISSSVNRHSHQLMNMSIFVPLPAFKLLSWLFSVQSMRITRLASVLQWMIVSASQMKGPSLILRLSWTEKQ